MVRLHGIFRVRSIDCVLTADPRSGSIFNQLHMIAKVVTRGDRHDMAAIAFVYLVAFSDTLFGGSGPAC